MLLKIVLGIQEINKNEKQYFVLHTSTADDVKDRKGFIGKQVETIFVNAEQMPVDLKIGSKIRVYYDNVGGKAYLSGIEVCK